MLISTYLISGAGEAWLCSSLDPIERIAHFADARVAQKLRQLSSRPGATYAYMESCEIDCDILDGMVTNTRELQIIRGDKKHRII